MNDILSSSIDELELTVRTTKNLKFSGIYRVDELVQKTRVELSRLPNIGAKSLSDIEQVLEKYNLSLGMKITECQGK
ncbi:DNA-directed RNA polymerase subunit alpha C-terminal domain-containing protein [Acidithiobacillus acidisediminis]|uniref:DNA-directed RNA polymerase subunit alpha C-terminal domain-containing protein n=1 Tax=Acidithiobacillus acidisediminis TaxID=2937799 RepID=UPI00200F872D|nr:DNA-directed RNA polymerase subunit alpha C-terminal domain-containing protein [Acidithiobacillus sp. S30A2]